MSRTKRCFKRTLLVPLSRSGVLLLLRSSRRLLVAVHFLPRLRCRGEEAGMITTKVPLVIRAFGISSSEQSLCQTIELLTEQHWNGADGPQRFKIWITVEEDRG